MPENIFQLMRPEFTAVAEAVVERMRALGPESKTAPDVDAYEFLKDPWEEYVLQIQEEGSYAFGLYKQLIEQFCEQEVRELSFHDLTQMWCATSHAISFDDNFLAREDMIEQVAAEVFERVDELAGSEELPHYWAERQRLSKEADEIDQEEEELAQVQRDAQLELERKSLGSEDSSAPQLALF